MAYLLLKYIAKETIMRIRIKTIIKKRINGRG